MIKKTALLPVLALVAFPLAAAPTKVAALQAYAAKALARCPDAKLTVQPVNQGGPAGFVPFEVTQTSSDQQCGRHTYMLYSPATNQVLLGNVFGLPMDNRTAEVRIADALSQMLKENLTVSIGAMPLPDGIHTVTMTKQTAFGPFAYHGFIDAAGQFLIVGSRGSLAIDPGQTLLESIGLQNAVRRGNPNSKVKIVEMSDFECPTCARAHKEVEPIIEKNLSKVDYYRLDLPLFEHHEWALPAALGARAIEKVAPSKYWDYVNFVFPNQEEIGKAKSFDDVLKNFCEDHDIDWNKVEKIYHSPVERAELMDQVSRAFDVGVNSTPTYIINGQMIGYGPSGSFTIGAIRTALGLPAEQPAAPKKAKTKSQR